jgi:hypothetical protein
MGGSLKEAHPFLYIGPSIISKKIRGRLRSPVDPFVRTNKYVVGY